MNGQTENPTLKDALEFLLSDQFTDPRAQLEQARKIARIALDHEQQNNPLIVVTVEGGIVQHVGNEAGQEYKNNIVIDFDDETLDCPICGEEREEETHTEGNNTFIDRILPCPICGYDEEAENGLEAAVKYWKKNKQSN